MDPAALSCDEAGLAAAYAQLGPGLTALAARIAGPETAEECVNDALLAAWQAIPPLAPVHLAAYLAKLTRNAALNRYRAQNLPHRPRRGERQAPRLCRRRGRLRRQALLARRAGRVPAGRRKPGRPRGSGGPAQRALRLPAHAPGAAAAGLSGAVYFYALPLSDIAARFSMRENTVKTTLHRTRRRLRDYLEQEELL